SAVSLVSVAVLKAAASFLRKPAFEHLRHTMSVVSGTAQECEKSVISMPTTAITVMSGGKATPGKLNLVKSVFAIANPGWTVSESMTNLSKVYQNIGKAIITLPDSLMTSQSSGLLTGPSGGFQPSYDKPEQPLDATIEAITGAGFTPGQDVFLGIDCSAHDIFDYDKGKYDISTGALKTADEMVDLYKDLVSRYPSLIMLVDPVRKEDREQWSKLCEVVSEKCFVIGSDAVYGSLHSVNDSILSVRRSSGLVIGTGSRITCSDLARVVGDVRSRDCVTMLVSPAGDVCDDIFADMAVGLGTTFVRFGAPSRGENTSKINRLVEIERML
uniref:phosphopyruvate hydratase n=1 Tax=Ciona savignyi TaxID=51511 RepID=H2YM27_CIOSA